MGYQIDIERLRWSVAFVDQDIQRICDRNQSFEVEHKELGRKEKELQKLKEKKEDIRLTQRMFAFGGEEAAEAGDSIGKEMQRLDEQIGVLSGQVEALKKKAVSAKKAEKFLADVKFLEDQARQAWLRWGVDRAKLEEDSDRPLQFIPLLESRKQAFPDLALQVKALLLQTFFGGRPPEFDQRALKAFQSYQSRPNIREAPMTKEKAAFFSVTPHLLLKMAMEQEAAGDREGAAQIKKELSVVLPELSVPACPYEGLIQYRRLVDAGETDSKVFLFLGRCYHYIPVKRQGEFMKDWLFWFEKAVGSGECFKLMRPTLEHGFLDFLAAYEKGGGKCLGDVFGKWKGQERFEIFGRDFAKRMAGYVDRYVDRPESLEEAAQVMRKNYPQIKAFAIQEPHPRSRMKRSSHFPQGKAPSAYEAPEKQLAFVCLNGWKERNKERSWLDWELNPADWDPEWVEGFIREIVSWQLGEYAAEYLANHVDAWLDKMSLKRQLDFYFTEVLDRGVWDEELDQGVRAMLEAIGTGHFWIVGPGETYEILKELEKFEGKEGFAPYQKILKKESKKSHKFWRFWEDR